MSEGSFALQLQAFRDKAGAAANEAVGAIVYGLVSKVDAYSPVGDPKFWKGKAPAGYVGGHFRSNWQLTIGSPSMAELPGTDFGAALSRNLSTIPEEAAGLVFYLANNVPYAQRLEFDHWSRQTPTAGIVGLAMLEIDQIVANAVAGAKE